MKHIPVILGISIGAICTSTAADITYGFGFGVMYSGIGFNLGSKSNQSLKYLSAGCYSLSYGVTGWNGSCGGGIGYVNTGIFFDSINKHGLGVHFSSYIVDNYFKDYNTMHQFGLGYHYFFNGIDKIGWNIGLTPIINRYDSDNHFNVFFNLGYQL